MIGRILDSPTNIATIGAIIVYLVALSIFLCWHIRSDRKFRKYMNQSQYFRQNFLEPIANNYTAIESGKADLVIAFYMPLANRETALTEATQSVRLIFPTATTEPYRTYLEMGGKEVPVLKIVLDARQRLNQEQQEFLRELPVRATVINNS